MKVSSVIKNLSHFFDRYNSCPYCRNSSIRTIKDNKIYKLVECKRCYTHYINPYLNDTGLKKAYSNYSLMDYRSKGKGLKNRKKMYLQDFELISIFLNNNKNLKILDIGGSDGKFLSLFDKKYKKFIAEIDHSSFNKNKDIKYDYFDGTKLPYKNNFFDLVLLRGVIEHIVDPISLIKNIKNKLKKGGKLFITATPDKDSFAYYIYKDKWNQFNPLFHYTYVSSKVLNNVVKKQGFKKNIIIHPYIDTPYENFQKDFNKIKNDIKNNKKHNISPPFYGTMLSGIWSKI